MRQLTISALLLLFVSLLAISQAQQPNGSEAAAPKKQQLQIVPLVTLKPGETKELLLSTWCTVGATRGGGLSLAEMRGGQPHFDAANLHDRKTYRGGGVTISVPNWSEAEEFASREPYAQLKQQDINAFKVTIAASETAQPKLMEMHLLDATCSGHCKTDFRVLVLDQ